MRAASSGDNYGCDCGFYYRMAFLLTENGRYVIGKFAINVYHNFPDQ